MAIRIGNNLANTINGTSGRDLIFGNGGDDVINAGAGNDLVFGGAGNDQIFAGAGNDWVFAGVGNDVVSGGAGNDFLFGDAGNDVLDGGLGSDRVDGGTGSDTLIFTDSERGGLDRYLGGSGQDALVLEFAAARWALPTVRAEVIAYLDFLAAGGTGNFTFATMNLVVSSLETLVVKVDGVIIDPRAGGNNLPTGVADSYTTGENGVLDVSPASERGTLVDNDDTGTGAFTVELVAGPANGALTLNADGTFSFNPGTAFDYLAAGQSAVETFTYRIVNSAGASEPITVSLNIEGANDAATLGGVSAGEVSEDGESTTASGAISITDADAGQAELANPGTRQGTYGSLALAADGTWTYTIDNNLLATQALGAEDTATEAFDISSADGTAASSISISVSGTNDAASIAGDLTGIAIEDSPEPEVDAAFAAASLTAGGQVIVTDADTGEAGVGNPGTFEGLYGTLVLQADGNWVYTLNNDLASVQALGEGDSVSDSIEVTSLDGSAASSIVITVEGTNDLPEVSGDLTAFISEDRFTLETESLDLTETGQILVSDIDSGESGMAGAGTYTGQYGSLDLAEDGTWTYTLDNDSVAVQSLGAGTQAQEIFELSTIDGSPVTLDIAVQGQNDEAFVDGNFFDTITLAFEETTAEGFITVDDIDTDESGVVAGVYEGAYGNLSMDADGFWLYQITNFDFPVDEEYFTVFENFELQTLGGDVFNIDITIENNSLIIG